MKLEVKVTVMLTEKIKAKKQKTTGTTTITNSTARAITTSLTGEFAMLDWEE
jgi:phage gpG-like protein